MCGAYLEQRRGVGQLLDELLHVGVVGERAVGQLREELARPLDHLLDGGEVAAEGAVGKAHLDGVHRLLEQLLHPPQPCGLRLLLLVLRVLPMLLQRLLGHVLANHVYQLTARGGAWLLAVLLLLRPGRLDRKVEFGLPDLEGRAHIFSIHARSMNCERDIRFELPARLCPNTTGADLRSVCIEAGMYAIRARRKTVTEKDMIEAVNKVVKGYSKFSATPKYLVYN